MYKVGTETGWGNTVLHLSDFCYHTKDPHVHSSVLSRGIEFTGFTISDRTDLPEYKPNLYINPHYYHNIHPICRNLVKPSTELQALIDQCRHLVDGVTAGIHIRRGWAETDSKHMGHNYNPDGTIRAAYFASDNALQKFIDIVKELPGKVFLASDSQAVKTQLVRLFPDKVQTTDVKLVLTYECTDEERLGCYLDWFLLSMCPRLFITGGEPDMSGFSTFGYSAAVYGNKPFQIIGN